MTASTHTKQWGQLSVKVDDALAWSGVTINGFWEHAEDRIERIEPAGTSSVLIFPICGDLIIDGTHVATPVVVRPSASPVRTAHNGQHRCVEVRVPLLLSMSMERTDGAVSRLFRTLTRRRQPRSRHWQDHFQFASDTMLSLLAALKPSAVEVPEASWTALQREPETDIDRLAHQLGTSTRHLRRLFRAKTGLSPSEAVQVARFERAWTLLFGDQPRPSLTETAILAGYSDQAHMTRAFIRFSGNSPARTLKLMSQDLPGLIVRE